ncbi:MAG: LptF/LptG family permease, partial [Chlamydiia bacterium]|nr:LptF/LptG family permease [Chlamydiia bacterium]
MMPILWRYLLSQYLRVLILTVVAIISVLMVTRLDEIAEFAILGAQGGLVLRFALYQIPYILPIALPIASVVAAILLYQRLSTTHEITALRASGMSLGQIVGPVLLASIYLTIGNLYLISEVATASHL